MVERKKLRSLWDLLEDIQERTDDSLTLAAHRGSDPAATTHTLRPDDDIAGHGGEGGGASVNSVPSDSATTSIPTSTTIATETITTPRKPSFPDNSIATATSESPGGGGLSTTTKIAIAVPIAVIGAAIIAIILFFLFRRRQRRRENEPGLQVDMAAAYPKSSQQQLHQLQLSPRNAESAVATVNATTVSPPLVSIPPPPPSTNTTATIPRHPMPLINGSASNSMDDPRIPPLGTQTSPDTGPSPVPFVVSNTERRHPETLEWRTSEERRPRSPFEHPLDNDADADADDDAMSDVSGISDLHNPARTRAIDDDDLSSVSSFEDDDNHHHHVSNNQPPAAHSSGNL